MNSRSLRIVDSYARWLSDSPIPKLFIDAEPAGFLIGAQREFCRAWPNQQRVVVRGAAGLPIGVQLIAQHRDELNLLRAATTFQGVTGWHHRRHPTD